MYLEILATLFFCSTPIFSFSQNENPTPLKIGVVGLVHAHVHWILRRPDQGGIKIVGIAEPNREMAARYSKIYGFSMNIVFDSIEEMLEKTKPEAVTDFGIFYNHLKSVELCAPKGIHVMVKILEAATKFTKFSPNN